jgi:hypothetical protein
LRDVITLAYFKHKTLFSLFNATHTIINRLLTLQERPALLKSSSLTYAINMKHKDGWQNNN